MSDDSPQRDLPFDPQHFTRRANRISRRAHKKRYRLPVLQPSLPVADDRFAPVEGVPRTRGDCPVERPCPHVRCRHHLFLIDADTRAGRPGLSSVPRDERGLTLPVTGDAGTERSGTTLRPGWLQVRGLEVEREVKVYVTKVDGGYELHELNHGRLAYWLAHLRIGEPVTVWEGSRHGSDDEPGIGRFLARARLEQRGIVFDREIPDDKLQSSDCIVFVRTREVSTCALDLIDRHGKMTNEQVGAALARHRTLVGREARDAARKAAAAAEAQGIDRDDFRAALMGMGNRIP